VLSAVTIAGRIEALVRPSCRVHVVPRPGGQAWPAALAPPWPATERRFGWRWKRTTRSERTPTAFAAFRGPAAVRAGTLAGGRTPYLTCFREEIMTRERSPAPYDDRAPAAWDSRSLVHNPSDAPIHQPGELRFGSSVASREELWRRLSPTVHDKVNQRLGRLLEWWAAEYDGRVSAVALGTRALIAIAPTVNAAGSPATEISTIRLNENSFRTARITAGAEPRAGGWGAASSPGGPSRPGEPSAPGGALSRYLDDGMRGFLGQLPKRAQELLQDPFVTAETAPRYDYFYRRNGPEQAIGGTTLNVWCYLADRATVTYCAGVGHGHRQSISAASWELTCWRAEVAPRAAGGNR
jgi:hypothetical protein